MVRVRGLNQDLPAIPRSAEGRGRVVAVGAAAVPVVASDAMTEGYSGLFVNCSDWKTASHIKLVVKHSYPSLSRHLGSKQIFF